MDKTEFEKYDTPCQILMRKLYADKVKDNPATVEENVDFDLFFCVLAASEQYEVEDKMMEFMNSHPDATIKELYSYFDEVTPQGLPPCASEWDDYNEIFGDDNEEYEREAF